MKNGVKGTKVQMGTERVRESRRKGDWMTPVVTFRLKLINKEQILTAIIKLVDDDTNKLVRLLCKCCLTLY